MFNLTSGIVCNLWLAGNHDDSLSSRFSWVKSSIICIPVLVSRVPVGSSAKMICRVVGQCTCDGNLIILSTRQLDVGDGYGLILTFSKLFVPFVHVKFSCINQRKLYVLLGHLALAKRKELLKIKANLVISYLG